MQTVTVCMGPVWCIRGAVPLPALRQLPGALLGDLCSECSSLRSREHKDPREAQESSPRPPPQADLQEQHSPQEAWLSAGLSVEGAG